MIPEREPERVRRQMAAPRSAADASTSPNERSQETVRILQTCVWTLVHPSLSAIQCGGQSVQAVGQDGSVQEADRDGAEAQADESILGAAHQRCVFPVTTFPQLTLPNIFLDHPELMQNVNVTPPQQLENLKQVRVRVDVIPADDNVKIESEESRDKARKLPVDRVKPLLYLTGVNDPKKVPIGKVSLREAIDMVRGHALDPETFNVKDLAEFHEMQEEDVYHVLDRFKTFEVYNNDDLEAHKAAPWYTKEKLEPMFFSGAPFFEHQIADQEDERRKAWKQYLEKKSKEKPDPKLLEIVGLKSFPAAKKRQAQKDADPPEPPKALP